MGDFEASVRILNPFNENFDAVSMKMRVHADFGFELLQDFTLVGNISDVTLEVTEFKTFFKSKVSAETVNKQFSALKGAAIKLAN